MPFRNLASWTGAGGAQSLEPDQNCGLWRNITPPTTINGLANYTLTSEDVMRGIVLSSVSCVYTMPTAAHLLADYPDWPIGASVTFGLFATNAASNKTIAANTGVTLVVGVATISTAPAYVMLWRDSDTTFKYSVVRGSF